MRQIIEATLQERFGLAQLFPVQEKIIERVLGGGDALVVLPTGSGKSLCYQLPALVSSDEVELPPRGVTLVFSPLIALMEDQVSSLKERGVRAEFINSTLGREERIRRYERLAQGAYELIYATPERMSKPEFTAALDEIDGGVRLLAIDEAHCITKWGHDFRPAYREVGAYRRALGSPTTVALTATATPRVREDIRDTLGLDSESMPLFATGIDRPNLTFEVREVWGEPDKLAAIQAIADANPGTGIVYFSLIRTLEELAHEIQKCHGGTIAIYHGRLTPEEKKRVYDRFVAARPEDRLLLLATNAFGMGVDKPDIRFIVHAQVPGSVEAYYQEVGRAGRDGQPSQCVLLYDENDLAVQQQFVDWMNPSAELLQEVSTLFHRVPDRRWTADEIRAQLIGKGRSDRRIEYCLIALEKLGVVERAEIEESYRAGRELEPEEIDGNEIAAKKERDLRRLLDVVNLVKTEDLRRFVLEYFGLDGI